MAKVAFTGGALNVTALLTGLTGTALTKALAKIAAFEAKVEAGKSASLKIGTDTFQFKKASGVQAVTFTNNGTAFTTAAALTTAATAPTPSPTPAPTVAPQALTTTAGETLFGVAGTNDTFTATDATYQSTDIIVDSSTKDADVLNVTVTDDVTATPITVGIETANFTLQAFSTAGTADTFEVAATNLSANAISVDLDKVGSAIAKAAVTGVKTGTTVTSSSDFATALTVSGGSDDESLTVSTAAAGVTVNSAGTLAAATVSSSSASAVTITTDTDGTATLTTTGAGLTVVAAAAKTLAATAAGDLVIGAAAATSVTASAAGTIDANTTDLTAATSATLTATKSIDVGFAAAASATLSAGGTTASTIDDAGTTLASLSLSGNGSAHSFDITDAEGVKSVTITGTQAVSIIASAADIDTLTDNKLTIVDNSSATSTLRVGTAAGDMDLSAAAVDGISLEVDNNSKTITLANKASLTVTTDQTALTVDGTTATGSTDSLTISLNDGATGGAVDLTALTITDFGSVIINASADDAASAITAVTATDNNTNVTINTGALGATLGGAINVGTGSLAVNATGAGALATASGSFTAASVAVTAGTGGVTGAGAYAADTVTVSSGGAITTGAITLGKTATITGTGSGAVSVGAVTKSGTAAALTINGGAGAVTLAATDLGTGALSISTTGAATTSSTVAAGSVSITAAGYTASGAINVGSTGTVTINSSAAVALGAQAITAASLTTSGAGAVTYTAINSTTLDSVTTGSGADALTVSNITATLTVNGGAGNDTITIGGNSGSSTVASIVGGDGALDTVVVGTNDISAGTVTLSGVERLSLGNGSKVSAAQVSGGAFIITDAGGSNAFSVIVGSTTTTVDLSTLVIDTAQVTSADSFVVDGTAATVALTLKASSLGDSLNGGTKGDAITGGSGDDLLSGAEGNDTISGGSGTDIVDSGSGDDAITAGAGTDSVFGDAGGDSIVLTETTSAADVLFVRSVGDGSAAGAAAGTFTGFDVITGFTSGTDDIEFDADTDFVVGVGTAIVVSEIVKSATAATVAAADLTVAEIADVDQVLLFLNDAGTAFSATGGGDTDLVAVTFASGLTALYAVTGTAAVVATEVKLIATVDAVLTAADLTI